jgi:hypothetical protein
MSDTVVPVSTTASPEAEPVCLDVKAQIELLQFSIGRYDHYFDSVNNKANFWLAFDSFVLGAVVVAYKDFVQPLYSLKPVSKAACWLDIEMGVFVLLSLLSIGLILLASYPFTRPPKKLPVSSAATEAPAPTDPPLSSLYYDHVAIRTIEEFSAHLSQLPLAQLAHDYHRQAHQLSQGLSAKYRRLRQAGWVLFAQLGVLALLFLTFLIS